MEANESIGAEKNKIKQDSEGLSKTNRLKLARHGVVAKGSKLNRVYPAGQTKYLPSAIPKSKDVDS